MTMKEKLNKLLTSKTEQRDTLNKTLIDSDDKEERAAIGETLSKLAEEIREIEDMLADVDKPADEGEPAAASADNNTDNNNERGMNVMATMDIRTDNNNGKEAEARAQKLFDSGRLTIDNTEARAVLVSSGKLATPTEVGGINDPVGARVSSIVDMVKIVDASNMGAYKVAYVDSEGFSGSHFGIEEGSIIPNSNPEFNFVTIQPVTYAVLSYISKQARKQTPLNYEQKVNEAARIALRRSTAALITNKILESALTDKISVTAIDEKTLRKIALTYGGDESVVGSAVLFINKTDLVALGDVRGSDKKPVYEITPDASNPNTGVIRDGGLAVQYCIDSNLTAGTLAYGQPKCFELAMFSNYDVMVSEDFAFDKGLLAIRGDVELGGDVTVKGGFVVATVSA
jgi:HK97 family phage major capsid protein